LTSKDETLPLPDGLGDSFAVGLDEPDSLTISVRGVYAVEYELTVRYASGVNQTRLSLFKNNKTSAGAFVERLTSGLPSGRDDETAPRSADVCMRGKTFMLLNAGDTVSLGVSGSTVADEGSVETCGGLNAYLSVQLLRAASLGSDRRHDNPR
jgi:hypothetical protein